MADTNDNIASLPPAFFQELAPQLAIRSPDQLWTTGGTQYEVIVIDIAAKDVDFIKARQDGYELRIKSQDGY